MTTPGARSGQQAYQRQVQNNSANFFRNAAYQDQLRSRRSRGPVGVIGRFFGFIFSLVFIAIVVAIVLVILGVAQPDWLDHVKTWFQQFYQA